jgi:mRNA interferase RelE/StbE
LLKPRAEKDLDRLRGETWERVRNALLALRQDPRPRGCIKLRTGAWRIRIGDYRATYDIDDTERTVTVLRVRHRRDIYREF